MLLAPTHAHYLNVTIEAPSPSITDINNSTSNPSRGRKYKKLRKTQKNLDKNMI